MISMPGFRRLDISRHAASIYLMSGSLDLLRGVGMQMFTVSSWSRTAKSVVARRRADSTKVRT